MIVWPGTSSKVQVKGGQNEKDGRHRGSLILLLGVTDSTFIYILIPLEDA